MICVIEEELVGIVIFDRFGGLVNIVFLFSIHIT